MRKIYCFLLLLLATTVVTAQTLPVIAYVTIQGNKQGTFKGGRIECVGFSYGISQPMDVGTGMVTGKRQHTPIVIVKRLDASSPQLLQAASSNESLKTVTIEFSRPGEGKAFQTIKLTNASVVKINQYGGTASPEKLLPNGNVLEEISFSFQKIEVTNVDGKTSASDDWNVR
ncbi:type VI secretion system tube protein TssD [Dinghuibacter silviterrae]|uniref:Type VI secretion system secreted protein Hcp n=1 Tax=Dinghuibacter silviterrae TaxID=1539049 RepID=A0A4R8DX37_9BACT|nr:type VI secretion system tube protein TssD [Dinghuibacter silviterrae]TDX02095.1 type VI secretion system secreted protein Hcp [Dinghuibacter silviterrae]